jgi:hypothetical protein
VLKKTLFSLHNGILIKRSIHNMRSKLINVRRKMNGPLAFMLIMLAIMLGMAALAALMDRLREPEPDLSLCPFCSQPVQL